MSLFFQTPSTLDLMSIIVLHDLILVLIIPVIILTVVTTLLIGFVFPVHNYLTSRYSVEHYLKVLAFRDAIIRSKSYNHSMVLEVIWTIFPIIILVIMCIYSFPLILIASFLTDPFMSTHLIGQQWFWTYRVTAIFAEEEPSESDE